MKNDKVLSCVSQVAGVGLLHTKETKMGTSKILLPSLSTHAANIALNRDLGLRFLLATPQETHGLTDWSRETLTGDQLLVAATMIRGFLGREVSLNAKSFIGMRVERKDLEERTPDAVDLAEYILVSSNMSQALEMFHSEMWKPDCSTEAKMFLDSLILQIEECAAYTRDRTIAIEMAVVSQNPLYLRYKNAIPAGKLFCAKVLDIARWALRDEAVERGYCK